MEKINEKVDIPDGDIIDIKQIRNLQQTEKLIKLDEWNPKEDIKKPNTKTKADFLRMIIVGPSDSGKSYLFKDIAKKKLHGQYDVVIVFCGSSDTLTEYKKIFNTKMAFLKYDSEIIETINREQENLVKKGKQMLRVLMIYDDFADRKNKHDNEIFHMAISGRHECMSFVMILHDLVLVDRVLRDQLTHLIITRQASLNVYTTIMQQYLYLAAVNDNEVSNNVKSGKQKLNLYLLKLLISNTNNYQALVFLIYKARTMKESVNIRDVLKTYKAS